MFGAVGQPMILGPWAKYSIKAQPNQKRYLRPVSLHQRFKVDANGNITSTNTGVVSPYGEFFPTQPGPVALITMPDIDTGIQATGIVQAISLALMPTMMARSIQRSNAPILFGQSPLPFLGQQ